jgi:ABC-type transport system involved in Fe-S cluster assembly fused permease/ATPase subunit
MTIGDVVLVNALHDRSSTFRSNFLGVLYREIKPVADRHRAACSRCWTRTAEVKLTHRTH